ncbi:protein of unknown function [Streptomyces murinus]
MIYESRSGMVGRRRRTVRQALDGNLEKGLHDVRTTEFRQGSAAVVGDTVVWNANLLVVPGPESGCGKSPNNWPRRRSTHNAPYS